MIVRVAILLIFVLLAGCTQAPVNGIESYHIQVQATNVEEDFEVHFPLPLRAGGWSAEELLMKFNEAVLGEAHFELIQLKDGPGVAMIGGGDARLDLEIRSNATNFLKAKWTWQAERPVIKVVAGNFDLIVLSYVVDTPKCFRESNYRVTNAEAGVVYTLEGSDQSACLA